MDLCPLIFTGQSNGVYYYMCAQCSNGTQVGQVGGQDTRAHLIGESCSNIRDKIPARRPSPKSLAASSSGILASYVDEVIEPVVLGDDAKTSGLPHYMHIDHPIGTPGKPETFYNAAWYITAIDSGSAGDPITIVEYNGPRGKPRKARIFTIRILHWSINQPLLPAYFLLQVGQEVDPNRSISSTVRRKPATHQDSPSDFHHHIQINESGDDRHFHILLKEKDPP